MKVICDSCKKEFEIKKRMIRTEKVAGAIERSYFRCSKCKKKYVVNYSDPEIKANIKRIKELKGEHLRKEIDSETFIKKFNNLRERNIELSNRYKALYKEV